jgi:hypothetical protein
MRQASAAEIAAIRNAGRAGTGGRGTGLADRVAGFTNRSTGGTFATFRRPFFVCGDTAPAGLARGSKGSQRPSRSPAAENEPATAAPTAHQSKKTFKID